MIEKAGSLREIRIIGIDSDIKCFSVKVEFIYF